MSKIKKIFLNNYKILIGVIIGFLITIIGVNAEEYKAKFFAESVSYNDSVDLKVKNVQEVLDVLVEKAKNYKKLDTETTATSASILKGKTAYDNKGNLVTGNLSTECVSGSFTYTGGEIDIVNFDPTIFLISSYSDTTKWDGVVYYNKNYFPNEIVWIDLKTNGKITITDNVTFSYKNGKLYMVDSPAWYNEELQFSACK